MNLYINQNKEKYLNELFSLLRIPSISAKSEHTKDCLACAKKTEEFLKQCGCDDTKIFPTKGHPIVFAEKKISDAKPTILVYGHYDVQPPEPLELWDTKPFDPIIKDNNIYARGVADDKGQFFTHIKAVEILNQQKQLECNIKFLIEGEEEVGSDNLEDFIKQNQEFLANDVVVISDSAMISLSKPSICVSARGLSYIEVEATAPNRDLHSGVYGGGVANPLLELSKIIASLHDENNRITIPHFYDNVVEITEEEKMSLGNAGFNEKELCEDLDIKHIWGEKQYSYLERVGTRPTLEINGMWGGYTGEGAKTVLPSKAFAKISCRLVPNQDFRQVDELLVGYFENLNHPFLDIKVKKMHGGNPYITPVDSKEYQIASQAMENVFQIKPIPTRGGGSIPITSVFEQYLKSKVLFLGYGLDSDNLHSPNEKFGIENFLKGIQTNIEFYRLFANQ